VQRKLEGRANERYRAFAFPRVFALGPWLTLARRDCISQTFKTI
jgi:hypothetical protein